MRLLMLGTRGIPARYGGFETAIEEIGSRLAARGHDVLVACRSGRGSAAESEYRGMRLLQLPALKQRALETLSHTGLSAISPQLRGADVAFVFNAANAPFLPLLKARGLPVAVHVDGLEWRRAKWSGAGQSYYRLAESMSVRWADALIADAAAIADYYRVEFDADSRVIAYGSPDLHGVGSDRLAELGLRPQGYHLVVARFEPENHVLEIVRGYTDSSARLPLVAVGSAPYGAAYTAAIAEAADDRVRLLGGVWDQELLDQLYRNAFTYLHGHSVGGTNPSLLRAAGAGAPVLAWDCVFNREVLGSDGVFFATPDAVASAVEEAEAQPDTAREMGNRLYAASRRYSWDTVADQYEQLARDLLDRRSRRRFAAGPPAAGAASASSDRPTGRRTGTAWSDAGPTPEPGTAPSPQDGGAPPVAGSVVIAHPSPDLYGSDRVLVETVAAFAGRGAQVTVALPHDGPLVPLLEEQGGKVVFLPTAVLRKSALKPRGALQLGLATLNNVRSARRLIRALRPDALFVNTVTIPGWLVAGRLMGVRTICHVHEAEGSQRRALRRALYLPLHLADRLIVNSQYSLDVMTSTWAGLRARSRIVYNGVPGPQAPTDLPSTRPDPLHLLFIGRLSPRKGPDVALRALKVLRDRGRDVHLTLLGAIFPGYEWFEERLRDLVGELGLTDQVTFAGFDPEVWPYFDRTHAVLIPSVVDEPFGNTAVESILALRPAVVSETSGLKEAASGFGSVEYVTPNDPEALADGVDRLADRWPTLPAQVAADRSSAAERYGTDAYARRLLSACAAPPG